MNKENIIAKYIVILLITLLMFPHICNAVAGVSVATVYHGTNGDSDTTEYTVDEDGYSNFGETIEGNEEIKRCKVKFKLTGSSSSLIYGYNNNNNSIIEGIPTPNERIKAGTSIKLSIVESKTATLDRSFTVTVQTRTCTDGYTTPAYYSWKEEEKYPCPLDISNKSSKWPTLARPIYDANVCSKTVTKTGDTCPSGKTCKYHDAVEHEETCTAWSEETETTDTDDWCKGIMERHTNGWVPAAVAPSFKVFLSNSNDISATTGGTGEISFSNCCNNNLSCSCQYDYKPNSVCINRKTANVRYIIGEGNCNADEMIVPNGSLVDNNTTVNYWNYFVPLNAKTQDIFPLSLSSITDSGIEDVEFCQKMIEDNPDNYYSFVKKNDTTASGLSHDKETAKRQVNTDPKGCKILTTIDIPIVQKFYKENDNKLVGYNFYYRPIDVNNPFPNGLSNSLYWKDKYTTSTSEGITKGIVNGTTELNSFDTITYKVSSINGSTIRALNNNQKYNSWDNSSYGNGTSMNKDGHSSFVGNTEYASWANRTDNSYYKLGCGPSNSSWTECQKRSGDS